MRIPEELIHLIWQFRLYDGTGLQTTDHQPIRILNCGYPSKHAGPDFTDAKIMIGQTTWVGQVEIHLKSSNCWFKNTA